MATASRRVSRPSTDARPLVDRMRSSSNGMVVVLPAPFGPEEAEHGRGRHGEIEIDDATGTAVRLRQLLGLDGLDRSPPERAAGGRDPTTGGGALFAGNARSSR